MKKEDLLDMVRNGADKTFRRLARPSDEDVEAIIERERSRRRT